MVKKKILYVLDKAEHSMKLKVPFTDVTNFTIRKSIPSLGIDLRVLAM